jgi:cysteinyl-tRNA synthetase
MGHSPAALRYALLAGHPRKQLNFTLDSLHAAESALSKLRALADKVIAAAGKTVADFYDREEILQRRNDPLTQMSPHRLDHLRNDLNTPAALGELFTDRKALNLGENTNLAEYDFYSLAQIIFAFGFNLHEPSKPKTETPAEVTALAEQRWAAKAAKNWAEADRLRGAIAALGWTMLDRKDGYSLEPAKK